MDRPIKWKNGARCAVVISFDVDGESPWILRDPALAERPLHSTSSRRRTSVSRGPSRSRSTT